MVVVGWKVMDEHHGGFVICLVSLSRSFGKLNAQTFKHSVHMDDDECELMAKKNVNCARKR